MGIVIVHVQVFDSVSVTTAHSNADAMSRLPLSLTPQEIPVPTELVLLMEYLEEDPITARDIREWVQKDPKLVSIVQCIQNGWPEKCSPEYQEWWKTRNELSMLDGCILWGSRVVVPEPGRARVLKELHQGHPGMGRLARIFTWWPKMDQEIEELVASFVVCQPEYLYSLGNGQLYRGHEYIDYAGPINNQML